ncbi:MAG: aminotransferase class V-fold PLP-dependent enzyme [Bacteroidetes bacterium]|nr:aminotransferase class V-fold PLP-dependent enzyme [Bacteroidota bacterium]
MDIKKIRKDTIGCEDKLFFNSAGSSLPPKPVVEKMTEYLQYEEQIGGYDAAKHRAGEIERFYSETAKLLNCKPYNVAFAYNATDAYARALSAIPFESGDYILTSNDDYISNQIAFLSLQKRFGIKILRADNLSNGDIDLMQFEELIKRHSPKLVAVTHVPTNSGMVQDVEEIGRFCKEYNTWYLVDACQSVGQLPVDVEKIGCDFLSATGRKFLRGPRGTGFLYVSDAVLHEKLEALFIDMRGADWINADEYKIRMDARRYEMWEFSYATVIGLAEAIRYANEIGIENIQSYNEPIVKLLREELTSIKNIRVLDKGSSLSNIVTFNKTDIQLGEMKQILSDENIYFSVSLKENAIIDFMKKDVDWAIRFSPHYFNTEDEVRKVVEIIRSI